MSSSGAMFANTTFGDYVFDGSGSCFNPYENSSKTPSEIKAILKRDYGFIDYNDGVLLTPYGEDYKNHQGGYVNNQIVLMNMSYSNNSLSIYILKDDEETVKVFKSILSMAIPGYANQAYDKMTSFLNSGQNNTTFSLGGKTIKLLRGTDNNSAVCWHIDL